MKKILFLFTLLSLAFIARAQDGVVSGTVFDENKKGLEAVTVQVIIEKTNAPLKSVLTDAIGHFEIKNLPPVKYLLEFTAVGFAKQKVLSDLSKGGTLPAISLILKKATSTLSEVTVTGKKPMIENKIDKMVVNVDAFITSAGGTALEILEKSPGVSVDKDGNVSLKGKQGVIILVDGKQTFLGGEDLANLLKNMPASQLETIEIMTQPSAKYDASGNSGIINIRTKRNKQAGFNGSANLSFIYNKMPKTSNSLNLNYKKGKVNLFGTYSMSVWRGYNDLSIVRKFRNANDDVTAVFDQATHSQFKSTNHNLRAGIDYSLTKKSTIGFVANGVYNPRNWRSSTNSDILDGRSVLDSINTANSSSKDPWKNLGLNVNFRSVIDTTGQEFSADIDYLTYYSRSTQFSNNYTLVNPGSVLKDSFLLRGSLPADITIYSAKADYVKPLKNSAKFETGVKGSFVETDNDARYTKYDSDKTTWVSDVSRSNHFVYKETILAAYANYSRQMKKFGLQTGLRYEHTVSNGKQLTNNQDFRRNYGQLFPTAYLSYAMNSKNQWGLSYGRRIERPNYRDMNPFQYFLDQYTYQQGNPYLKPQFSHNIEVKHTYNNEFTTTVNYSQTSDIINDILKQNDQSKVTYQTKENIAKRRNVGISINYNKPITKWWTTSIFMNAFNNKFNGFVNNAPLDVNITSMMFNVNNQLRFKKGWGFEASGFYRTKMQDGGLIVAEPMGVISFGASKQVLKGKGTLKLNVNDPFALQYFRGYTKFGNIDAVIRNRWDNRRVGLSFNYRFGKPINGQTKQKSGSAEDEQKRIGG